MSAASNRRSIPRRRALLIATSTAMLLVGCVATWWWTRSAGKEQGITCVSLFEDKRIQNSLGDTNDRHGCAKLGSDLKDATTGKDPDKHSLKQARVMRDILLVLDERLEGSESRSIEPSLQVPLAEMLADYANDTHEILKDLDAEYLNHELSGNEPWEDSFGVHMVVPPESLLRVMRAVSENPTAYATIRMAESRRSARVLAETPQGADEAIVNIRACGNALAFGSLDAIASNVTANLTDEKSTAWVSRVAKSISSSMTATPAYTTDPASHITGTWAKSLEAGNRALLTLRNQSVTMLNIWAEKGNVKLPEGLVRDCKSDASRKHQVVTEFFEGGILESRS
ncbi:hypothetical protein [Streptomyces sp. NPDC059169]|uniref:hypothetical protein n=1 Tax=unclassified Streptomyces TaxID=2593676 RepID=UPI0036873629